MIMRDPKKETPQTDDTRKPLTLVTIIGGVVKQTVWSQEKAEKKPEQGGKDAPK